MFRAEDPQGQDLTDDKLLTRHTIEEVLPALKRWRDAERSATAVHGIRERVSAELKHRSVYKQLPEASATKHAQAWDADEICDMVKALVDSENQLLYRKSLYPAAEAQIEAEPELIVHRVILHIRCVEKGRCEKLLLLLPLLPLLPPLLLVTHSSRVSGTFSASSPSKGSCRASMRFTFL